MFYSVKRDKNNIMKKVSEIRHSQKDIKEEYNNIIKEIKVNNNEIKYLNND